MTITPLQQLWLYSVGGRTIEDVKRRNRKMFVLMRSKREDVPVEIPNDKYINDNYTVESSIQPRYYQGYAPLVIKYKKPR